MNPNRGQLNRSRRRLPHWQMGGATYYVTFRLREGVLSDLERRLVIDHLLEGEGVYYRIHIAVVMPDHVHILLRPAQGIGLSRVMKGIKGVSAKLINEARGGKGSVWQDESYDRIMRDEAEAIDKARYTLENPVRAGLVDNPLEYPYLITSV